MCPPSLRPTEDNFCKNQGHPWINAVPSALTPISGKKSPIPERFFDAPFRIASLPQPHHNRFYASFQRLLSASSPTALRKRAASLRRASDLDAARHAARPCPSGTAPGSLGHIGQQKCVKNRPKRPKEVKKWVKKQVKIWHVTVCRAGKRSASRLEREAGARDTPYGAHLPLRPRSRITRKSWALVKMDRAAREPRLASLSVANSLMSTT
jgi:hypothetical protein